MTNQRERLIELNTELNALEEQEERLSMAIMAADRLMGNNTEWSERWEGDGDPNAIELAQMIGRVNWPDYKPERLDSLRGDMIDELDQIRSDLSDARGTYLNLMIVIHDRITGWLNKQISGDITVRDAKLLNDVMSVVNGEPTIKDRQSGLKEPRIKDVESVNKLQELMEQGPDDKELAQNMGVNG